MEGEGWPLADPITHSCQNCQAPFTHTHTQHVNIPYTHPTWTDHMHIHHTTAHVCRQSGQYKYAHNALISYTHYTHMLHMNIPSTHAPHNTHMCVHTTDSTHMHTQTIYTVYTYTHMLAPSGYFIEESELLVCGMYLPGILFSCFQALHSFWIQNLALEGGPGGGMTRLPPAWNQRNSTACFLIPGKGQAFPPTAKGLCFRETKPDCAMSRSPRPPQILLLGCLS